MPSLAATAPTVYSGLSERARATLAALESHDQRGTGLVWPGIARLARLIGKSRRTVERALADLEDAGLIQRRKRPYGSNVYRLIKSAIGKLCQRIAAALRPRPEADHEARPKAPRPAQARPEAPRPTPRPAPAQAQQQAPTPPPSSSPKCRMFDAPREIPSEKKTQKNQSGGARVDSGGPKAPSIDNVSAADLANDARTDALYAQAAARGYVQPSELGRVRVFTAAEKALRIGKRPGALFAAIIRAGLSRFDTNRDEDAARERIKALDGRALWQRRAQARREQEREEREAAPPPLAPDAALYARLITLARGNGGAVLATLRRRGWTPDRIEQARVSAPVPWSIYSTP